MTSIASFLALARTNRTELEVVRTTIVSSGVALGFPVEEMQRLLELADEFSDVASGEFVHAPVRFELYRIGGREKWICGWGWEYAEGNQQSVVFGHVQIFVIDRKRMKIEGYSRCA